MANCFAGEREIAFILLGEQGLVALAALPVGLLLGYAICALLVPLFNRENFRLPLTVSPLTLLVAGSAALLSAAFCGVNVARRLKTLDLIAAAVRAYVACSSVIAHRNTSK